MLFLWLLRIAFDHYDLRFSSLWVAADYLFGHLGLLLYFFGCLLVVMNRFQIFSWVIVDSFESLRVTESLWIIVSFFRSLRIVVGCFRSLWVVPGFI